MFLFSLSLFLNQAQALSCPHGISQTYPNHMTTQTAPSNLIGSVWISNMDAQNSEWTLRNIDNGDEQIVLPTLIESDNTDALYQFSGTDLIAGEYELDVVIGNDLNQQVLLTVGNEIDETPPETPTIAFLERFLDQTEWGNTDQMLIFIPEYDLNLMYRVETTANGQFDDDSNVLYTYSSGREIFFGESYCEINHTSDELDAITHIRLTAIDMAGNESEPFVFEVGSYITNHWDDGYDMPEGGETNMDPVKASCSSTASSGLSSMATWFMLSLVPFFTRRRVR